MPELKYKIIKSVKQYDQYCKDLEALLEVKGKSREVRDEMELLTFLIEKWDDEHFLLKDADPVELLHSLMKDRSLKAKNLVKILGVSKGLVSDILNYKKGLSKEIIRILSVEFKVSQEAFNRPYKLKNPIKLHPRDASVMNTPKKLKTVS
jgi:HTH-type transcriptional regulator / antitoxin HigA